MLAQGLAGGYNLDTIARQIKRKPSWRRGLDIYIFKPLDWDEEAFRITLEELNSGQDFSLRLYSF